ncbi:MAG: rRNA adenine N-6-methyltransferase family protein [Candidatus Gracilibacteria bacterium]|nr:rRNA adenine N-6-methyltransferase family protein [Candidatus Gracilibacteria bacterium]
MGIEDLYNTRNRKRHKRAERRANNLKHKSRKHDDETREEPRILSNLDPVEIESFGNGKGVKIDTEVILEKAERSGYIEEIFSKMQDLGILAKSEKLSQHFLVNENAIDQIVKLAQIQARDRILEIGAGPGNLTGKIWKDCQKKEASLSTIEIDENFRPLLATLENSGVKVFWGDALTKLLSIVRAERINKIVANIPYAILEPLLMQIHSSRNITQAILLVGKRYANRALSNYRKEDSDFTHTSLFSQARFSPEIVLDVPREDFFPEPRTASAVVKLTASKSKDRSLIMIADAIIKQERRSVRALLLDLSSAKITDQELRRIRSFADAKHLSISREKNDLGLSDDILNTSVTALTNQNLHRVLLKADHLKKKRRSFR